jgi:hypothetical protein
MDTDLERMSREQLIEEVKKLRQGIRRHRDSNRHELCWHHPALWGLLPERTDPVPTVPEWPQFLEGCIRYRQSLDEQVPHAPRTNEPYAQLALQPSEQETLVWTLQSTISDLGAEIADTENQELRNDLKERKAVLMGILARLK